MPYLTPKLPHIPPFRAAADAIKFTVDQKALQKNRDKKLATAVASGGATPPPTPLEKPRPALPDMEEEAKMAAMVCSLTNKDECLMCGS